MSIQISSKMSKNAYYDKIFKWLMIECGESRPSAKLSGKLQTILKRLRLRTRSKLVARTSDGATPLFIASQRGSTDIVLFLVVVCGADVEQRGLTHKKLDGNTLLSVTPLWAAAREGHLPVVHALAELGADPDTANESGDTAVYAACSNSHMHTVRFLTSRGANINSPNKKGHTCLMAAVSNPALCEFLINNGALVDERDVRQHYTALQYAVKLNVVNTIYPLLKFGASQKVTEEALQLACLMGAISMVEELIDIVEYPPEIQVDSYELLAAIRLEKFNNVNTALALWRKALVIRKQHFLPKRPEVAPPPREVLQFAREFRNEAELEAAAADRNALQAQALIVLERVLGSENKELASILMTISDKHPAVEQYQRCVDLRLWVLEIRLKCLCLSDAYSIATHLIFILQDEDGPLVRRFQDAFHMFTMLTDALPVIDISSRKDQVTAFDYLLMVTMHLMHTVLTMIEKRETSEDWETVTRQLHKKLHWLVVVKDLRSYKSGDTLLHLSAMWLYPLSMPHYFSATAFPSLLCIRALLKVGAEVNAINFERSTPLHMTMIFETPPGLREIVMELLKAGAHVDQANRSGIKPSMYLARCYRYLAVPVLRYRSLKCLAATAIDQHRLKITPSELPDNLARFLREHQVSHKHAAASSKLAKPKAQIWTIVCD